MNRETEEIGRYLNEKGLCEYTTLGRGSARNFARAAGAAIKIGKRVVYDRTKIDEFMESMTV